MSKGATASFFHRLPLFISIKVMLIMMMLAAVSSSFYLQLTHFNTTDPMPEFTIIDEAKQKEFGAFTVKVQTGMFIKNFPSFDMIKNLFVVDGIVWFEFNSDEMMLDTIGKFSFDNGKIVQLSPPDIRIDGNKTFVKYDVRVEFKSNLNYAKFPFEDHRISLVLTNNFVTPQEMFFMLGNTSFAVSKNIFISNWIIKDLNTDTGYSNPRLDSQDSSKQTSYPQAAFILNIAKGGIRKVLIIFIPLFFGLLLSLSSFLLSLDNLVGRATLSVSGVTALLGYRFVIEQMMPEVGYFTLTDTIYILLFLSAFFVFIFQTLLTRYVTGVEGKDHDQLTTPSKDLASTLYRLEIVNMLGLAAIVFLVGIVTIVVVLF